MIAYLDGFFDHIENLDSIREHLFAPVTETAHTP
jgi:hypothetical protein